MIQTRVALSVLAIFFLVIAMHSLVSASHGGEVASNLSIRETSKDIWVGVYILHIGKYDIASGAFSVDFYLSLRCKTECPEYDFEFMNGKASSVEKIIDLSEEKFYRIKADLVSPADLKKYPFDSQRLQIILEDKRSTLESLQYLPSGVENGIDPAVSIPGWQIVSWNTSSDVHEYEVYGETYSRYIFNINLERVRVNAIIKTFLPIFIIMLVALSSFVLDPDKLPTRMGMVGSALVASVMFHVSLTNQIPPVGYLTLADKFMILTYFILLLSFILNVTLMEFSEQQRKDKVEKLHRMTEYWMIAFVVAAYLLFFIFVL